MLAQLTSIRTALVSQTYKNSQKCQKHDNDISKLARQRRPTLPLALEYGKGGWKLGVDRMGLRKNKEPKKKTEITRKKNESTRLKKRRNKTTLVSSLAA